MTPPATLASLPVHQGIDQWLAVAVTDDLSPQERALFDAHLAGCAACRALFAEEIAMNQTIQHAFDAVRPLPGFERRLTAAFRQRRGVSFHERWQSFTENVLRRPAVRVLGAVAVVLALISLGQGLTREPASLGTNGLVPPAETQVGTGPVPGETVQVAPKNQSGVVAGVAHATKRGESIRFPLPVEVSAQRYNGVVGLGDDKTKIVLGAQYVAQNPILDHAANMGRTKAASLTSDSELTAGNTHLYHSDAIGGVVNVDLNSDFASENAQASAETSATSQAQAVAASPTSAPVAAAPLPPEPGAAPPAATSAPDSRKLIRNASVALEVAAFDPALDALGVAATQVGGGYVATADSTRQANGKRRGTIVIKVLPDKLDAFLARLHDLGTIKSQNIGTEDVTKDYFDTDARLRNARRMEDRLLKILDEDKGKLSEILQVEKELGRVREDIEKMQGELQLYDALVRYATVTVDLFEKDLAQPATFLLQQTADLSLLATDVEKAYGEARHIADDAHAQIENSDLVRSDDGRVTARLRLLLAPETSESVLTRLKALARIENFKLTGERVAQNGDASDTGAGAARLERGPVTVNLSISHDEATHFRVTLTVTAADTAAAFDKARAAGAAAGGEIVSSDFTRDHGPHGSGLLVLRVPALREPSLLDTVRSLGRTSDLNTQRDDDATPDAELAPVLLTLHFADERMARRISLTLFAPDLDAAFDKARAAALAAGGEVMTSSFNRVEGQGSAMLTLRLPGHSEAAVLGLVRGLGRTSNFNVQRDTATSNDAELDDNGPASLLINLTDHEPPVQQTRLQILCAQVEKRQAEVRQIAADAGAKVSSATFTKGTNAGEEAALEFRLPLRAYPDFISRVRSLGEVKDFSIQRRDTPATEASADGSSPAEVSLRLYSQGHVVSDDAGLGATLRRTLAQGFGALMWSLRMIGVALAFLAPWVVALLVLVWLRRLFARRQRRVRPPADQQ